MDSCGQLLLSILTDSEKEEATEKFLLGPNRQPGIAEKMDDAHGCIEGLLETNVYFSVVDHPQCDDIRCETKSTVIVALNIQMCCCFEDRKHAAIFLEVSGAFISSMKKGNASVQIARDDEQTNWDAMHAVP
ncbi:hypothetical protein EV2_022958 [Malus domestica]